jgi:hypothetical protein
LGRKKFCGGYSRILMNGRGLLNRLNDQDRVRGANGGDYVYR